MYPGIDHFNFYSISNLQFLYHMETTHFKKGLPSASQPWLAQGKDRQTLRGLILYGWQAQFHQQVKAAKSFNEGAPKYRHKIYLPRGYTIPSPKLPQGQRMFAFILRLKI